MNELDITFLSPERFATKPQVGLPIRQEWSSLVRWLTWPSFADSKKAHGAWCPAALVDGVVKEGTGPVSLLVADVDDCAAGAIEREAEALAPYAGVIVPTFNATLGQPKNRIVLVPSRALQPDEFRIAWTKMASELSAAGITVDKGCKNINRLYFACVSPSPDAWLGARILTGQPVDVDAMLAIAREEIAAREAARPKLSPVAERSKSRYVAAAIDKARTNISTSSAGGRHDMLLREAYSLARFDLSADQIESALLEAFVHAAGEARRAEGKRAIRNAVDAKKGAA